MVELAEIDDSPSKLRAERVKRFTEEDSSAVVAYKLAAKLELYDQADGGFESKNGRDKGTPDYSSDDYSEGSGKDTD